MLCFSGFELNPRWVPLILSTSGNIYTAISRKVVGKSARDSPDRYCGWFWVHWSSKKFARMARETTDLHL